MTQIEALKLALEALEESLYATTAKSQFLAFEAIAALKEALAQPEQEPICPKCKATVLYECVACSSNSYPPPQRTEENT
jgi:hypothetical protein